MLQDPIHHEQHVVAVATSDGSVEQLATALAVHGIRSASTLTDRVYPSVSRAQGFQVRGASGGGGGRMGAAPRSGRRRPPPGRRCGPARTRGRRRHRELLLHVQLPAAARPGGS